MPMFEKMHHLAIIASDYARAKAFYVDTLGFEVLRENFRAERGDWKLDLRFGESELELFVIPGAPARLSYPEALGLRHLAFFVEDVDAAVARLAEKGVACEPVRLDPYTNRRMTFFRNPDGLPLELHE